MQSHFARIKSEISPGDESLLTILRDPQAASADGRLFTLTRWDKASLDSLLAHFGISIAGLADFDLFRRVYDAFELIQEMGISAGALIKATTNEHLGFVGREEGIAAMAVASIFLPD